MLRLAASEVPGFEARAAAFGVTLVLREEPGGSRTVAFLEHAGGHCPMLDDATSACRIYDERPQRCRAFPDKPQPGCAISGAE